MKLSHKFAGILGCGAFILVSLTTYFGSLNPMSLIDSAMNPDTLDTVVDTSLEKPLKVLTLAFPSALLAGFLGYFLGGVLRKPKGSAKQSQAKAEATAAVATTDSAETSGTAPAVEGLVMTGNETFLDDVSSAPGTGNSPDTSRV